MQQAPQYPQRQAIMQGHQMQPGQQAYPMAYQNAGYDKFANNPCSLSVSTIFSPVLCCAVPANYAKIAAVHASIAPASQMGTYPWNWEAIQSSTRKQGQPLRHA